MHRSIKLISDLLRSFVQRTIKFFSMDTLEKLFPTDLSALAAFYGSDKWGSHWYARHYQQHFSPLRWKKLNILEIGAGGYDDPHKGGASLRMWKRYFPKSNIYSIDIYDKSALQEERIKIFKGSQIDSEFILKVYKEIGEIDIIIDDGSHINQHVIESFAIMFPLLKSGGIYVVEDLQTSYWDNFGGSCDLNSPKTSMHLFKCLVDSLNYEEFPDKNYKPTYFDENIISIHFYHNMVFIYKGTNKEGSNLIKK